MRLFIAITLDETMKDYIMEVADRLRLQLKSGGFTLKENLHLTLNFIGETSRLELVKEAMQKAVRRTDPGSFTLEIAGFGKFNRREGDICYIGIQKNPTLWKLQRALVTELKEAGFEVDDLEYKPHLTLVRRGKFMEGFDEKLFREKVPAHDMEVTRINLMKSERIQGKLVYTEVYGIEL